MKNMICLRTLGSSLVITEKLASDEHDAPFLDCRKQGSSTSVDLNVFEESWKCGANWFRVVRVLP
jgi:hypothetical protein